MPLPTPKEKASAMATVAVTEMVATKRRRMLIGPSYLHVTTTTGNTDDIALRLGNVTPGRYRTPARATQRGRDIPASECGVIAIAAKDAKYQQGDGRCACEVQRSMAEAVQPQALPWVTSCYAYDNI